MAHSLRRAAREPEGSFTAPSGTVFTIRSGTAGTRQRMEHAGDAVEFAVAYVIGSGGHASGYLIQIGDHLFQSPLCYYTNRRAYGLAPGYERLPDPDFTRPVGEECVLCHAGRALYIAGTVNRYAPPVFTEEAISCDRCHGPVAEHLRRPVPGSIVNPAKLAAAERDSICEQCHLAGVARIPNPGMDLADFRPGQALEEVFTVYTPAQPPGAAHPFKVISHAEQLARSACARNSRGRLWCGTCHDPHPAAVPTLETYNARCNSCHRGKLASSHPIAVNCVGCHMTRRQAQDGGHTVFTDHRITRRPEPDSAAAQPEELAAWRDPAPALRTRNQALAYLSSGIANRSPAQMVRGYRMLTDVQKASPDDVAVLKAIGRALLLGRQPQEALKAFAAVLRLVPDSAGNEENAGIACLESGRLEDAAAYLERALQLDPLLLTAATPLEEVYRRQGQSGKAAALADRMRRAIAGAL
jgi:Flp pilus assembly protein TadD